MSDTERSAPPRDGLVRAQPGMELRAGPDDDGRIGTLSGHFSVFDAWYEVDSAFEGHFMERVAPGAFADTFTRDRAGMRVTFNHGQDPQLGDKVLGPIEELEEDRKGARYVVPLLDTSYNRDLLPGLKAGVYGSSFRFNVEEETFDHDAGRSKHNPEGLPERTITRARVHEFGPVTFPASASATAGARSLTDRFRPAPVPAPATPALARKESPVTAPVIDTPAEDPQPKAISRLDRPARIEELRSTAARFAQEHTGTLSKSQSIEWDAMRSELRQLEADQAADDERLAFLADHAAKPANITPVERETPTERWGAEDRANVTRPPRVRNIYDLGEIRAVANGRADEMQLLRDSAMRSVEQSYVAGGAKDGLARFIDRELSAEEGDGWDTQEATRRVLLTGNPAYKRAFAKYLKTGNDSAWTPEESRAAALAVTGTTTTGGYAVPYVFDPTFVRIGAHTSVNPYRAACRVETISGGNTWKAVTATAITAKWDAEAAASVEGGPTIGQPSWTVQRADAFATVSIETLQDRPDVVEELSALFGEAKDTLEENSFTLGAGTTVYPQGMFLSGAFTVVSTATDDTTAIADTLLVEAALPLRHRANAAWFMSRSTQRQLEALDTTGYYFKRPGQMFAMGKADPSNASPIGNTGTTLLGFPIWEVPSAPATLTTDQAVIAVLCDPKKYVIVDRIGMNVEVVPTMLNGATPSFPTGQRGIYCYWRATARVLDVNGGRQLDVN